MKVELDKVRGALIGTFVGDALGMPVEGMTINEIRKKFGTVRELYDGRLKKGSYTDDTQLMIGVAESLIKNKGFDGKDMASCFLDNFSPERGYGRGTTLLLEKLKEGVRWNEVGTSVFKEGSFGNGAAMRSAPFGVFYYKDIDKLIQVTERAACITHANPLGYQGAILVALSVAFVLKGKALTDLKEKENFIKKIIDTYNFKEEYKIALVNIIELLNSNPSKEEVIKTLGNSVEAHRSVPAAIYSFLRNTSGFEEAVVYAVNLGGDTDTIGAMTGSLAGAFYGYSNIPKRWLLELEDSSKGHNYVLKLADQLYHIVEEVNG